MDVSSVGFFLTHQVELHNIQRERKKSDNEARPFYTKITSHTSRYTDTHTYHGRVRAHTRTHACTHARTRTRSRKHAHTCTHAHEPPRARTDNYTNFKIIIREREGETDRQADRQTETETEKFLKIRFVACTCNLMKSNHTLFLSTRRQEKRNKKNSDELPAL